MHLICTRTGREARGVTIPIKSVNGSPGRESTLPSEDSEEKARTAFSTGASMQINEWFARTALAST